MIERAALTALVTGIACGGLLTAGAFLVADHPLIGAGLLVLGLLSVLSYRSQIRGVDG